jgi:hypothetical protein
MCSKFLLQTRKVFFGEIRVFAQLSRTGVFRTKRANVHLEKGKIQDFFLSKTNSILKGEQCARSSSVLPR